MRLLSCLVVAWSAVAQADTPKGKQMESTETADESGWTEAEAKVREKYKDATEVSRKTRYQLPYSFSVAQPAKAHSVLVWNGKVYTGRQGLAFVGKYLKGLAFLKKQQLGVDDLIFLVHEFGETPPEIQETLADHPISAGVFPGYEPKLTFQKGGATLVVHAARKRNKARRGGDSPTPTLYLVRATLTISKSYRVSWKLQDIKVPQTGSQTGGF